MKPCIRIVLGAILPVLIYCFAAAAINIREILGENPKTMGQMALLWLGWGFLIMGIPSIVYSLVIERMKKRKKKLGMIASVGAALGFAAGACLFFFEQKIEILLVMCIPGAIIGAVIPLLLHPIKETERTSRASQCELTRPC